MTSQGENVGSGKNNFLTRIYFWIYKHHHGLVVVFILCFLISGIITLQNFGISWDEGLGDFFFGERYLFYLTTFQDKYLDFNTDLSRLKDLPLDLYQSPFRVYPYEFPAFADILSAASMHLFSYTLHWMDPVDAFHLFSIAITSIFLYTLYAFFSKRTGKLAAFFAIVFLASFPRLWGDMHFNPKDIPVTVFIGFVIMAYLSWYERPKITQALLTGVLFGCAVAIKANAVFTPIILLLGIWPWNLKSETWKSNLNHLFRFLHHYAVMGLTAISVYFLSWPYLYADPMRVLDHVRYITTQGGRTGNSGLNWTPLLQVITTMPEVMLIFLLAGLFFIIHQLLQKDQPVLRLWLAWLIVPIIRISLPGMINFGGIRHFLEFIPAAALIAGYGAASLVDILSKGVPVRKLLLTTCAALLIFANITWITLRFHPYQYIYYNSLIGGLPGAAERFGISEATDYWAVSYRQGLNWLNQHTMGKINLYVPIADWLVRLPQKIWLRPGIEIIDQAQAGDMLEQQQPFYVMIVNNPFFYDEIAEFAVEKMKPAYQITVDGSRILNIYQMKPAGN